MGWYQVLEFNSLVSSQGDNLYAGPRTQPPVSISVKLPSDDWLCQEMEKLNLILTEGYATRSFNTSGPSGLSRYQFNKVPYTQKWYDVYWEKRDFPW